jgi:hypothetical protein
VTSGTIPWCGLGGTETRAISGLGSIVVGRWNDGVMSRKVRYPVTGVVQASTAAAMRIRTRIRCSATDMAVLSALARHFERLQGRDLAVRCRARLAHGSAVWAERKRALTQECSPRFAGWITKSSNDTYATARRNQRRALAATDQAITVIEQKMRRPVRSAAVRKALRRAEAAAAKAEGRRPRRLQFYYWQAAQGLRAHRRGGRARQARPRAPRPEEGTGKSRCDRRPPEDRSRRARPCSCGELPRARTRTTRGAPRGTRRSPAARGHRPRRAPPAPGRVRPEAVTGVTPGIPGRRRPFAPAPSAADHHQGRSTAMKVGAVLSEFRYP